MPFKKGQKVRKVEPDQDESIAGQLWHSGLWLHTYAGIGSGSTALNMCIAYSITENDPLNHEFGESLRCYLSQTRQHRMPLSHKRTF